MPSSSGGSNLRNRRTVAVSSGDDENDVSKKKQSRPRQQPGLGKRMDVSVDIPIAYQVIFFILLMALIWFLAFD